MHSSYPSLFPTLSSLQSSFLLLPLSPLITLNSLNPFSPPSLPPSPPPPLSPPLPSTSTDRYANVDVGVLLYHIERFPGIIILTTNLIDNIDKAFFRRLRFVLQFDTPPFKLRTKMWRVSMGALENYSALLYCLNLCLSE